MDGGEQFIEPRRASQVGVAGGDWGCPPTPRLRRAGPCAGRRLGRECVGSGVGIMGWRGTFAIRWLVESRRAREARDGPVPRRRHPTPNWRTVNLSP